MYSAPPWPITTLIEVSIMSDKILTQEYLKQLLSYCPDTGVFTWLVDKGPRGKKGHAAGYHVSRGYFGIEIDQKPYKSHRLAFLYMNGSLPDHQVDHINHDRADNSWANLRLATSGTNSKNRTMQSNNTSGVTGVIWDKRKSAWRAVINVDRVKISLGYSQDKSKMIAARKAAEIKYGFHANHGVAI